jgi:hypothetical protein
VFGAVHSTQASFAERLGRGKLPEAEPPEPLPGDGPYKAYGYLPTSNIGETCEICRWIDGTTISDGIEFQYRFLMQVGFVGDEELRLFLPDCIVVLHGRNLRELRKKLSRRQVTFIRQYSERVWREPPRPDSAVIDRVEIVRP